MAIPILTYQYFTSGRLAIAGLAGNELGAQATQTSIQKYINLFEPKYLKRLLGDDLYDAFKTGMSVTTPDARWTNLAAQIYDTTAKESPIANLVWYKWLSDHQTVTTASGMKKATASDAASVNNVQMITDIYNDAVDSLQDVYDWLETNEATYPEWEHGAFDFRKINIFDI